VLGVDGESREDKTLSKKKIVIQTRKRGVKIEHGVLGQKDLRIRR